MTDCHLERDRQLRAKDAQRWKAWHAKNRLSYNAKRRIQAKTGRRPLASAPPPPSPYQAPDLYYWTRSYEPSPDCVRLRQAQLSQTWHRIARLLARRAAHA